MIAKYTLFITMHYINEINSSLKNHADYLLNTMTGHITNAYIQHETTFVLIKFKTTAFQITESIPAPCFTHLYHTSQVKT